MPHALQCIASLVKISNKFDHISNKFDHISVCYIQKTAQKQPKIVLSVGMKTCEISKLENYKSDINETWCRYVLPEHLHIPKHEVVNKWVGGGCNQKATRNCLEIKRILTFTYHLKPTQIILRKRGFFIAIHNHLTLALT